MFTEKQNLTTQIDCKEQYILKSVKEHFYLLQFTRSVALGLIALILGVSCDIRAPSPPDSEDGIVWRQRSFAKVEMLITSSPRECLMIPPSMSCPELLNRLSPTTVGGSGSSTVAYQTSTHTYVLTAYHVCRVEVPSTTNINTPLGPVVIRSDTRVDVILRDFNGGVHSAEFFAGISTRDICLMRSPGVWGIPAPRAGRMPTHGEMVTNTAAPRGVYRPGMVISQTGRYSGSDTSGRHFYSIPAVPGSSGSGVFNRRGELVGVIHSAFRDFQFASIATSLVDINTLMQQIDRLRDPDPPLPPMP